MHHYHHRAFYLGVLSVALIAVGLLALKFPVFIDSYDQWGWQIKCGTGFGTDLTQAADANGGDDYVGQCETALMLRRIWAIPMVAIGLVVSALLVLIAATVWGRESAFGEDKSS
ncbi:MAG: hypothetical protein ACRDU5_07000 [Mycobacterium sp.]